MQTSMFCFCFVCLFVVVAAVAVVLNYNLNPKQDIAELLYVVDTLPEIHISKIRPPPPCKIPLTCDV